jgi:hypothetical protein
MRSGGKLTVEGVECSTQSAVAKRHTTPNVTRACVLLPVDAVGFVAPAEAEAQKHAHGKIKHFWIPAYAGMTEKTLLR